MILQSKVTSLQQPKPNLEIYGYNAFHIYQRTNTNYFQNIHEKLYPLSRNVHIYTLSNFCLQYTFNAIKQFYIYHLPSSCFWRIICARVHRRPDRTEAAKTIKNPSRLNSVEWYVNMNRPPAINRTTITKEDLWKIKYAGHILLTCINRAKQLSMATFTHYPFI